MLAVTELGRADKMLARDRKTLATGGFVVENITTEEEPTSSRMPAVSSWS